MSAVTTCPKCFRPVSLPSLENPAAWARCPLCRARYPLQAALDFVPPALEIVAPPFPGEEVVGEHEPAGGAAHVFQGDHAHGVQDEHGFHGEHGFHDEHGFHGEHVAHAFGASGDVAGHEHFGGEHFHEGGEEEHDLGGIATMVQTAPAPRTRRKVPLRVRIIGISIMMGLTFLGCLLVYTAFLFFGGPRYEFGIGKYFPAFIRNGFRHSAPPADSKTTEDGASKTSAQPAAPTANNSQQTPAAPGAGQSPAAPATPSPPTPLPGAGPAAPANPAPAPAPADPFPPAPKKKPPPGFKPLSAAVPLALPRAEATQ